MGSTERTPTNTSRFSALLLGSKPTPNSGSSMRPPTNCSSSQFHRLARFPLWAVLLAGATRRLNRDALLQCMSLVDFYREEFMTIRHLSLVAAVAITFGTPAHADEIRVLSTNALKTALEDLSPKFEQSSGHKLAITWGTAAQLKVQIEKGAVFDVAIITDAGADDLVRQNSSPHAPRSRVQG